MQDKALYMLTVAGLGLWISVCSSPACAVDVFVTKTGSFAPPAQLGLGPDEDLPILLESDGGPFRMIETAVCAQTELGGIIAVGPGTYRETFTIDKPVTLIALDGPFTVGDLSNYGETTLKVVTYNTHLYGPEDVYSNFWRTVIGSPWVDRIFDLTDLDEWADEQFELLGHWQDEFRAVHIVQAIIVDDPDVVVLQEVWDSTIAGFFVQQFELAGYQYYIIGNEKDNILGVPDPLHSGLLVLSKFELLDAAQVIYDDEEDISTCVNHFGDWLDCPPPFFSCLIDIEEEMERDCQLEDAWASKSFIFSRIRKDGFEILLYNTHTQATTLPPGRPEQVAQLVRHVLEQQAKFPMAAIVVTGDFNERGEGEVTFNADDPPVDCKPGSCTCVGDVCGDLVYSNEPAAAYISVLGLFGVYAGVFDAARNAPTPCFITDPAKTMTVDPLLNSLDRYYWPAQNRDTGDPWKISRIDYFFANGSTNGVIELLFESTVQKPYQCVNNYTIIGDGSNGFHEDCNLSDHFGLLAEFKLYRIQDLFPDD